MTIEPGIRDFLTAGNFAVLTTLMPDGRPQSHVMWVDADDDHVLINTEIHRQKFKNVEHDPRVTVTVWAVGDPYRYVEIRGTVVETVRGEQARAHIDACSQRYFGRDYDGDRITSERVILRIAPDRIIDRGAA